MQASLRQWHHHIRRQRGVKFFFCATSLTCTLLYPPPRVANASKAALHLLIAAHTLPQSAKSVTISVSVAKSLRVPSSVNDKHATPISFLLLSKSFSHIVNRLKFPTVSYLCCKTYWGRSSASDTPQQLHTTVSKHISVPFDACCILRHTAAYCKRYISPAEELDGLL